MLSGIFLISVSSLLVLIGTHPSRAPEKREVMSANDAKMFPIFGSIALLGLFFALKYIPQDIFNKIFGAVFSCTGVVSVYKTLCMGYTYIAEWSAKKTKGPQKSKKEHAPPVAPDAAKGKGAAQAETAPSATSVSTFVSEIRKTVVEIKKAVVEMGEDVLRLPNIVLFGVSVVINGLYLKNNNVMLGNILGASFAITGLQEIKPDSTHTVLLLLGLLFVYDIFWVFCTSVMIDVAKGVKFPIKIVYPFSSKNASMIGLGDIVIPGLYLGVAREFSRAKKAPWVFIMGFIGYVVSLMVTFGVVLFFKKGQPALLYICPLIVGTSLLGSFMHRKTKEFVAYTA